MIRKFAVLFFVSSVYSQLYLNDIMFDYTEQPVNCKFV